MHKSSSESDSALVTDSFFQLGVTFRGTLPLFVSVLSTLGTLVTPWVFFDRLNLSLIPLLLERPVEVCFCDISTYVLSTSFFSSEFMTSAQSSYILLALDIFFFWPYALYLLSCLGILFSSNLFLIVLTSLLVLIELIPLGFSLSSISVYVEVYGSSSGVAGNSLTALPIDRLFITFGCGFRPPALYSSISA